MIREASLTEADSVEIAKCRRDHNRLGFAYQIGFVRLFSRFPAQQPLEMCDELLSFVATQLNVDTTGIDGYAARQHTVSDHQTRIRAYLQLVVFDPEQAEDLERFVFEERAEAAVTFLKEKCEHSATYQERRAASIGQAARFSWNTHVDLLMQMYQDVLGEHSVAKLPQN